MNSGQPLWNCTGLEWKIHGHLSRNVAWFGARLMRKSDDAGHLNTFDLIWIAAQNTPEFRRFSSGSVILAD